MAEVWDYNVVDGSNTARFPEGQAPSTVNNGARANEGIDARWYQDTNGSLTTTGTASAYVLTPTRTMIAYFQGMTFTARAHVTCDATPTLNVGGQGNATIKWSDGSALKDGDIQQDAIFTVVHDSSDWQLQSSSLRQQDDVITTRGDVIRGDSGGNAERLALGASGLVLASDGTDLVYSTSPLPREYVSGDPITNNVTDSAHDLDFPAGSWRDDTNTRNVVTTAAFTKRIDALFAEGTNQGGLDAGTVAANTLYTLYAIAKNDGTADFLISASATSPTLPSGFTVKRRLGNIRTDASANIDNNRFSLVKSWGEELSIDYRSVGTGAAFTLEDLPENLTEIEVHFKSVSTNSANQLLTLRLGNNTVQTTGYNGACNGAQNGDTANVTAFSAGIGLTDNGTFDAADQVHGLITLKRGRSDNFWQSNYQGNGNGSPVYNSSSRVEVTGGANNLVQLTTIDGTAVFDGGEIQVIGRAYR
ncbi:MAG: hypothetical protein ACR2RF_32365 [Geminicoccaceae bacterium]